MGQKRDYSEVGSPEPRERGSFNGAKKHKHSKSKHRPNEGTSTWAKKRTRTIERLLNRNQDLPADVRNDLERELGALKNTVSDKSFQRLRSAMISKYHMVRFFERKKAARLVKQLRKKIEETETTETDEIEGLKRDLHVAEVDEAYTQHFPHAEPYISLYTNAKSEKEEEDKDDDKLDYTPLKHRGLLHTERPPMWSEVEQAMKNGPHALRTLRERRPAEEAQEGKQQERHLNKHKDSISTNKAAATSKAQPKQQTKPEPAKPRPTPYTKGKTGAAPKNRRERRLQERQGAKMTVKGDDDDSDEGGFFED
ncbi:related to rRNA-processing protein efg-1 [Fusarium torulosum]|uniref:rRNA-processing protein EFG1 n=1 Tax=Fusarium torulosum TaxID=33205 RepID=A0AAE8SMD5_9HYPO|nr:related to rRNA-processing protein efg-1 [Fusarium torulosum]